MDSDNGPFFRNFRLGSDLQAAFQEAHRVSSQETGVRELMFALFDRQLKAPFSANLDVLLRHNGLTRRELENLKSVRSRSSKNDQPFRPSKAIAEIVARTRTLINKARGESRLMEVDDLVFGLAEYAQTNSKVLTPLKVFRIHAGLLSEILALYRIEEGPQSSERSPYTTYSIPPTQSALEQSFSADEAATIGATANPPASPNTASNSTPQNATDAKSAVGGGQDFSREASDDQLGLNVNAYATIIAMIFRQTAGEFCFAIYGRWGRGKSKLAELAAAELKKTDQVQPIRFSAWQYPTQPEVWVYLYEQFAEAAFGGSWMQRFPNIVRTAIARHGTGRLSVPRRRS